MLIRRHIKCNACNKSAIFRIGLGLAAEQKFIFPCPSCNVDLRGTLRVNHDAVTYAFESEDIKYLQDENIKDEKSKRAVTVYTDLLVHQSTQGKSMEVGGSAFIFLSNFMGRDSFSVYSAKAHILQSFRLNVLPWLRHAASFYSSGNQAELEKLIDEKITRLIPELKSAPQKYVFHRAFGMLYVPLLEKKDWERRNAEFFLYWDDCFRNHTVEFKKYLRGIFTDHGFAQFKIKLVDTIAKCFGKFDAFVPPLAYEHFTSDQQSRIDEFRMFRDDFDELKTLYVDIFELSSKALVYLGAILNLSKREKFDLWADGKQRSLEKTFKLRAVDREFIIEELPIAKPLFDKIKRHTRNDFGHYSIRFEPKSGFLVNDKGDREYFLLFLVDFLNAVRLTSYLILLEEKVSYCRDLLKA